QDRGMKIVEATLQAVRMRLRPILMTSLAFGFGVLPLAIGTGAGAGGRQAIGTSVLGGMVFSTLLGIFFVPVFFLVVRRLFNRRDGSPPEGDGNGNGNGDGDGSAPPAPPAHTHPAPEGSA
ncbi:MAG: multidrug efflux RND transporter permease subunit, partial [Comamonadaceae bacterium]